MNVPLQNYFLLGRQYNIFIQNVKFKQTVNISNNANMWNTVVCSRMTSMLPGQQAYIFQRGNWSLQNF